jgi:hypothetical protein
LLYHHSISLHSLKHGSYWTVSHGSDGLFLVFDAMGNR